MRAASFSAAAAADLTLEKEVMKKIDAVTKEILYPMG
jgi:hypothetical protein